MMKRNVKAEVYTCDNPDCQKEFVHVKDEELPLGYYLSFSWIHGGGGDGASDVFACSESCIVKAMDGAMDRQRN
jgi:hypothetical protein